MSAHVDQLPRHRVGLGIRCFTQGLVAAADRGERQHRDHWVEQPASAPAPKLSMDADDHPDGQRQHGGGPHPVEHLVHRGAKPHQEKAAQSHEQGRSRGPSLWLIGEPDREHRQHRPAQRESAQDGASDGALLCRDERGGGEEESSDESGGQRAGDDPTNVSPRPRIRAGRTVPALVLGDGGGFGSHDGLHSMHSPAPHRILARAVNSTLDDDHRSRSPGGTRVPRTLKAMAQSPSLQGSGSDGVDREALWKEAACHIILLAAASPTPSSSTRAHRR